jgi:hypothetical protein
MSPRELIGLSGQPHRLAHVAGRRSGEGELRQSGYLPERLAQLPGDGQGPAAILGRFGEMAQC